jgi:cytochrome b561
MTVVGATNGRIHYTRTAVTLHWLMAALILSTLVLGWYMADLPFSPSRVRLFNYHKWIGITILGLAAARLIWRLFHLPPELPVHMPRWQQQAAHVAHWGLYAFFFAVPLTGWAYSSAIGFPIVYLGLIPLPDWVSPNKELGEQLETVHACLAYTLAVIVAVHIAGAIQHTVKDGSAYLKRMLSFRA